MRLSILGNLQEVRTEVEISDSESELALVYDSPDGWVTEILNQQRAAHKDAELNSAIEEAREALSHYVNRRGEDVPDGLTAAGLSLWLMEKDDGTAMGRPIP